MSFKTALKKLEALPPAERQLCSGQYVWTVKDGKTHCGCAIGKLLPERTRMRLFEVYENKSGLLGLLESFFGATQQAGVRLLSGLTYDEAASLQNANDGPFPSDGGVNSYASRKARYRRVIAWLRGMVARE